MSRWRHWAYAFPAGELDTLWRVLDRVPVVFGPDLEWTLTDKLVVSVADGNAAAYLHLAFGGLRPESASGLPVLDDNEVLIALDDRSECERLLSENCPSEATWFTIVVVSARTDAALRAFDAAYVSVTGLPGAATDAP